MKGFLDTCWDTNYDGEESNGRGTDADEYQEPAI